MDIINHLFSPASLFWRILLLFLLVVLVAVTTMGVSAQWLSEHERPSFLTYNNTQRGNAETLARALEAADDQHNTPVRVQTLVERQARAFAVQILLVDQHGQISADSLRSWLGRTLFPSKTLPATIPALAPILHCSDLFARSDAPMLLAYWGTIPPCSEPFTILSLGGTVATQPLGVAGRVLFSSDRVILASANDILLLAMLIGGMTALLLAVIFSLTMILPLKALTRVAYRMQQGDWSQRVTIRMGGELALLGRALTTMAESLERAEHLRRQMVSDIAHELRTPLTTIQASLDACEDGVLEPGPAIILSLQEEAMLLGRLVADLQELSVAEAGHLKLDCTSLALERCLHVAMQGVHAGAQERHITLAVEVPAGLPWVTADAGRVGQILRNLLTNALTHTPAGGTITVSAVCLDREVEVCIKDTGSGIAPEHVPYLFERFYRADGSRSRKTGGTGLGLAIVKQLVQAHSGHIRVESTPGQGTSFLFTLPIE
ncbi:MAG: ATP-binding protein [Ktedonobacteraceae bacterium]